MQCGVYREKNGVKVYEEFSKLYNVPSTHKTSGVSWLGILVVVGMATGAYALVQKQKVTEETVEEADDAQQSLLRAQKRPNGLSEEANEVLNALENQTWRCAICE